MTAQISAPKKDISALRYVYVIDNTADVISDYDTLLQDTRNLKQAEDMISAQRTPISDNSANEVISGSGEHDNMSVPAYVFLKGVIS